MTKKLPEDPQETNGPLGATQIEPAAGPVAPSVGDAAVASAREVLVQTSVDRVLESLRLDVARELTRATDMRDDRFDVMVDAVRDAGSRISASAVNAIQGIGDRVREQVETDRVESAHVREDLLADLIPRPLEQAPSKPFRRGPPTTP